MDAVKGYAYLDRDRLVKIDVHDGLDVTLALLRGRLEGVTVARTYDHSAPMLAAHGAALNQAWTNLLDNAIDATQGRGRIEIVIVVGHGGSITLDSHAGRTEVIVSLPVPVLARG